MFDRSSRYQDVETAELSRAGPDGRVETVRYKRRRFLPPPGGGVALAEHVVAEGDRIDNVTARYIGDPTQFWRLCDAHGVLRPADLVAEPGAVVRITLAGR